MKTKPLPQEIKTDRFAARLYRRVRFSGSCWEFNGCLDKDGYPVIKIAKAKVLAHRASYFLHTGSDPLGLLVCHKCDNTKCINPLHLFAGTNQDNILDASRKGRLATGSRNGLAIYRSKVARGEVAAPVGPDGKSQGEANPAAVLTEENVLKIRLLYSRHHETYGTLAKSFGVTKSAIAHIVTRKSWRHI